MFRFDVAEYLESDEHTSADGVFIRTLRGRKWLVLASTILLMHSHGIIQYVAINKLTGGLVELSRFNALFAILSFLIWSALQYVALFTQFVVSYHAIFSDRILNKVEASRLDLSKRISDLEMDVININSNIHEYEKTRKELRKSLARVELTIIDYEKAGGPEFDDNYMSALDQKASFQSMIDKRTSEIDEAARQVKIRKDRLSAENSAYKSFSKKFPQSRLSFQNAEKFIDWGRVLFPFFIMLYALAYLIVRKAW